ncbi:MAG TPA: hypothetical protein VHQ24_04590 [Lachnospiraceae bacterium]|nr:hypothetical protein [Lachnospiraceae bacterium]
MNCKKGVREIKYKQVYCNVCGKQVKMEKGILKEDIFTARKEWGFFSERDTEVHSFNICESCYDEMISKFAIPIEVVKKKEVL